MWTRVDGSNTYAVEQVFTELIFGCTEHICLHSHCSDCSVMRAVDIQLQTYGGITGHAVFFCVVRRAHTPLITHGDSTDTDDLSAYTIERIDMQTCTVPSSAPARVVAVDCAVRFPPEFTALCRRQIVAFVDALPGRVLPADPHMSMHMSTPRQTTYETRSVACTMTRFEIDPDPNTVTGPNKVVLEVLPEYSPPLYHYNCAEGGVMLLEDRSLSVAISHSVVLDFTCRGTTRRVCMYMHATNCAHTPRVNVCFQNLDVRTPMAAVVYAVGSQGGAQVHRLVSTVNMRKNVLPYEARSEMYTHTSAIDRLHQTRYRTSHNIARWPRALHAFANADDTNIIATPGQRAHMCAACATDTQLAWALQHMPPHQLYALDIALQRDVLVHFFKIVRAQSARISQLRVCGTAADALQDHLVALHLGYTPAFSVLYAAGIELALTMGALCEPQTTHTHIRIAKKRLSRVREQQTALGTYTHTHRPPHIKQLILDEIAPLLDFTTAMRGCLVAEVVCECIVDVFHGGSLMCAQETPMFASPVPAKLSVSALNTELRARSLHPGPCYEHNAAHLHTILAEDMERGVFYEAKAAWPQLTRARLWLREVENAGCAAPQHAALVRDFVAVSVAHHRASAGRPLHGTHAHARVAYGQKFRQFMCALNTAL